MKLIRNINFKKFINFIGKIKEIYKEENENTNR